MILCLPGSCHFVCISGKLFKCCVPTSFSHKTYSFYFSNMQSVVIFKKHICLITAELTVPCAYGVSSSSVKLKKIFRDIFFFKEWKIIFIVYRETKEVNGYIWATQESGGKPEKKKEWKRIQASQLFPPPRVQKTWMCFVLSRHIW